MDNRTLDDLSDEEFEDYEKNPENLEQVTENTNTMYREMMFPDGTDEDYGENECS